MDPNPGDARAGDATPITSDVLREALQRRYEPEAWLLAFEVANSTGAGRARLADAVAVGLWDSRGREVLGFEIKVSRADLRRELADPAKADPVARYCDRWWLVTPAGVVQPDELPGVWGLLQLHAPGAALRVKRQARKLDAAPPSRGFMAAFARAAARNAAAPNTRAVNDAHARGYAEGRRSNDNGASAAREHYQALRRRVDAFHRGCGVDLLSMNYEPQRIGEAVTAVLEGGDRIARQLEVMARGLGPLERSVRALRALLPDAETDVGAGQAGEPQA